MSSLFNKYVSVASVVAGVVASASAANWNWLAEPLSNTWFTDANWDKGAWAAASTDGAGFPTASSEQTINVNGDAVVGALTVSPNGSYLFTNGTVTVNGSLTVEEGAKATFAGNLRNTDDARRLQRYGAGTLELTGTNQVMRLDAYNGETVFNGGYHELTGASTDATYTKLPLFLEGTSRVIITNGAKVVTTGKSKYAAISGGELIVTDGVLDMWDVSEFLHGFSGWNSGIKAPTAKLTVRDRGVANIYNFRLGQVKKTDSFYTPDYARTLVETGGVLRVSRFALDVNSDYLGTLDLVGGTLVVSNVNSWAGAVSNFSDGKKSWTNVLFRVGGSGGKIHVQSGYNYFNIPIRGMEAQDNGVEFSGSGFLYFNVANLYNGPTRIKASGSGGYLIPSSDAAFGVVPSIPTPNILFERDGILHFSCTFNKNRDVAIATNVWGRIGSNGTTGRIRGVIKGAGEDGHLGSLHSVDNWAGMISIGPDDDRTNRIGRLYVQGHLKHVAGTTLVTSNATGKTAVDDNAKIDFQCPPFCIRGKDGKYQDHYGVLEISGGLFKTLPQGRSYWVSTYQYGQLKVNGGVCDLSTSGEFLNGINGPGKVIVEGTGTLICNRLRITQATTLMADGTPAAQVHLNRGGTLKTNTFWIDANNFRWGTVFLNGGTLVPRSSQDKFLGEDDAKGYWHTGILVRSGEYGAVVDTDGKTVTIRQPILSGAAHDGGFTKKGAGTLTLNSTNSYNGVTRVDAGQLKFAHADGFPGGDLEVSAKALKDNARTSELINAVNLTFREGAKIRVVDTDEVGTDDFGAKVILAKTTNPMTEVPPVVVVDAEGNEKSAGAWCAKLADGGKTLTFGVSRATTIILR